MDKIQKAIELGKRIRVIGFDDAPFDKKRGEAVNIAGVVCSDTRFEGMLWGEVEKDGLDSTQNLIELVSKSKFIHQLHIILLDGLAFGGFNLIDLPSLADSLKIPCVAVMRRKPDMDSIYKALSNFNDCEQRTLLLTRAGEIHESNGFTYQCAGIEPEQAGKILSQLTDTGNVPEALRLAHLIGAAVKTGQSSNRA